MIKNNQKSFYVALGNRLTIARQQCNISIAQLAQRSGEQYATIQSIEAGKIQCSLHHLKWMKSVLGLDLNQLVNEGNNEQSIIDVTIITRYGHESSKEVERPGNLDDLI